MFFYYFENGHHGHEHHGHDIVIMTMTIDYDKDLYRDINCEWQKYSSV